MQQEERKALYISDLDGISLFRALVEYDRILELSMIADTALVSAELHRVRAIQERLSLLSFYPNVAAE